MTSRLPKYCHLENIVRGLALSLAWSTGALAQGIGGRGAPEIDPGLAAAGLVLLVGGTLVLTGRRRPATN
jgi:hypothetical protein